MTHCRCICTLQWCMTIRSRCVICVCVCVWTLGAGIVSMAAQLLREFRDAVNQQDRTKAFALYDKMYTENPQGCYMIQMQVMNLCRCANVRIRVLVVLRLRTTLTAPHWNREAAHLSDAMRVFKEIAKEPQKLNESVFLPLIRCYIDAKDVNMALGLIQQMVELGVEPR